MGSDLTAKLEGPEIYSQKEAIKASTEYFKGDDLAARVWVNKYALKDSFGNIFEKTPDDMHKRLAKEIARIESNYENPMSEKQIYSVLKDFKYIVPQGGPMTGIGNNHQIASLSNCFVIGNSGGGDSYGGIMKIDQEQVQLMKRRGGVGHDLSHIRPKGSPVKNSALTSTGIVPFMERYSNSTREVAQDGRRGALMLSVSINHPDSGDFIDAKMEQGKVTGANVSVKIQDDFMESLEEKTKYTQQFPVNSEKPIYEKEIDPLELWEKIVHNAWKSAEPGILFWDTIINESIPDSYANHGRREVEEIKEKYGGNLERIAQSEDAEVFNNGENMMSYRTVSTNPCGEIPLCPNDSCRLLAINLFSYVENPFTPKAKFNKELFKEHVQYAQRIMDDIIDLELEKVDAILEKIENDPEEENLKYTEKNLWQNIRQKAEEGRRTGVGITAEGDMLAALGLRYGTEQATDFSEEVHKMMKIEAYRSSTQMAEERGAFKIYNAEIEEKNKFIQRLAEEDPELYQRMQKSGRRNISLLTVAPTGTTSIMTQTTSGIEPVFMPVYKRRRKVNPNDKDVRIDFIDEVGDHWEEYTVFHHKFKTWMEVNEYDLDKEYSQEELDAMVEKSPYYKATSNDIDWLGKVKMQGRIQKHVDHSISVTINVPKEFEEEQVGKLYFEAWKSGCKGVTIYRDGSRSGVLIGDEDIKTKVKTKLKKSLLDKLNGPRPEFVDSGIEEEIETPYGYNAFVSLKWEKDKEGNLMDTYGASIDLGKAGDDMNAIGKGFEKALSIVLRSGVDYRIIASQLEGIGRKAGEDDEGFHSLPEAIGKGLVASANKQYILLEANKKENIFEESLERDWAKRKISERLKEKRPEYVGGLTEKVKTPYGKNAFITLNWEKSEEGKLIDPYETFIEIGKDGDDINSMAEGLGRIISTGIKVGIPYEVFSDELIGIGGETQVGFGDNRIISLADAIGKGIERSAEKEKKMAGIESNGNGKRKGRSNICTECGAIIPPSEGCGTCLECGNSKCG